MSGQNTDFFWEVASPFLKGEGISKGTMMGFPCLRVQGQFFASADHRTGDLIVKLPATRVTEIIDAGGGEPFAPAGRTFREWVKIVKHDAAVWRKLIEEAQKFVESE